MLAVQKDVERSLGALADVAKGCTGGKDWLEDFAGTTFPELLDHARGNILKVGGQPLAKLQGELQEASGGRNKRRLC